jgi:hypothetical protein
MKSLILIILLAITTYAQTLDPVREFKIYSSDSSINPGEVIWSGQIPKSKIKDFIFFIINNNDIIPSPVPVVQNHIPPMMIMWDKNPEPDVISYIVTYWQEGNDATPKTLTVDTTTATIPIAANILYFTHVKAMNTKGLVSDPSITISYRQDILIPSAPIIQSNGKTRYINVLMSTDSGLTYTSIGKVPYPKITGQRYKTAILEE